MKEDIIIPHPNGFEGFIREIQVGLEFLVIASLLLFAYRFLKSWKENKKPIFRDEFVLFFLLGISRIMLMIYDFWIYKDYVHWEWYWKSATMLQMISIAVFTYRVEHDIYMGRSKYLLTIANLIAAVLVLPFPYWTAHYPTAVSFITVGIIGLTYIYVGLKLGGVLRKKALLVAIGIFLVAGGMLLRYEPLAAQLVMFNEVLGRLAPWLITLPGFVLIGLGLES